MFDTKRQAVLARQSQDIGRGHAEVLMAYIEKCLSEAQTEYKHLEHIGVTIGPGSFTGVRVGMSVARGFGLSLNLPVVGISTLEACEATARDKGYQGELISLLDAKRGELYYQTSGQSPFAASYEDIAKSIASSDIALCGSGAQLLNEYCRKEMPIIHSDASFDIGLIAKIASKKPIQQKPPEPLYLRSADAKVQAGFALKRMEQNI